ncbi:hypothetical protein N0V82_007508 [Gnomoniopsis sp. IMI 355080]|nr:hypothetical protein N0V82_007508 [Gnomoniopsis sp. IMI 355080]
MASEEPYELLRPGQPSPSSPHPAWKTPFQGRTAAQIASWMVDVFKPELLSRRKRYTGSALLTGHESRPTTAWLDGLRGWAALSVCVFHVTVEPQWHVGIESCYRAPLPGGGSNTTLAAWPIIRLLWSGGHFAVLVFYTISGYVLPRRLISLLHEGRQTDFVASLHAAVCRRPSAMYATFFAGMVTAELDLLSSSAAARFSLPWDKLVQLLGRHSLIRTLLLHAVFLGALYLGSQPSEGSHSKDEVLGKCHGWKTLSTWTPEAADDGYLDFWWFWAAWLLLFACKEISWLKRGLEAGFSQCSFALYLPILAGRERLVFL